MCVVVCVLDTQWDLSNILCTCSDFIREQQTVKILSAFTNIGVTSIKGAQQVYICAVVLTKANLKNKIQSKVTASSSEFTVNSIC